ncbi:glycoside hydrolase family 78 protein [Larkinella harenae]
MRPDQLTCEYRSNPLGIDTPRPRLSWTLSADQRNQRQTAYELLVSDDLKALTANRGTAWASGKIASPQSLHIAYSGQALQPFTRYYWRVRVYDQNGQPSAWSAPAWFETALLKPSDWQARWIGDDQKPFDRDEDFYQADPMPLFRKAFTAKKKISSARLYISGVGYYEAYLNVQKVGDQVLDPGWTAYGKQVLYSVFDVTSLLRSGPNVAGIMLGNGWYNPLPLRLFGRFNLRDVQQTGRPCVKAQIRVRYADESVDWVTTDESWETAPGPVLRNSVYLGEHYDARQQSNGWNTAGQPGSNWKKATLVAGPSGTLTAQMQPPVRVTNVLKPVAVTEPKPGVFVFDLGQNFAGVARIRVQGSAGTHITLRYGEDIHKDGSLNVMTTVAGQIKVAGRGGPGAPPVAWQEDSYILHGNGREVWNPRFTFHGFRYVEVTGWPGKPTLNDLEGLRMNSDLADASDFACSNELFNRLNAVTEWTFLSNVFSVQSDCPAREKLGYGGDIMATSEAFIYHFDMANFYRKAVRDFVNDQRSEGGMPETAPFVGIADRGPKDSGSGPLGWQLAFPYLMKQLHLFYGDKNILEENYAALVRQMEYLHTRAQDGLFHQDISDHEALDTKPEALTASSFYYHHLRLAAEFAGLLAKTEDSTKYARRAAQTKGAILQTYLVPRTGRFDNATQSAQVFALWYGFAPESEKAAAFQRLEEEIARHKGHVSTGLFATKMLFDVMRTENRNDLAYRIMNQRDFPGWGYMLEKGATTIWETWAYSDNVYSQNHPMFGSATEWFYRSLLGINPLAAGFERVQLKPQPTQDLTWAKGHYASVRGKIGSDWKIENGRFQWQVSVPPNVQAEIWVPAKANSAVQESGKPASEVPELRFLRTENGYAVYESGSGVYSFSSDAPN